MRTNVCYETVRDRWRPFPTHLTDDHRSTVFNDRVLDEDSLYIQPACELLHTPQTTLRVFSLKMGSYASYDDTGLQDHADNSHIRRNTSQDGMFPKDTFLEGLGAVNPERSRALQSIDTADFS